MVTFSLGYEGEEVPGEVKALEINPVMPQQVCISVFTDVAMYKMIAVSISIYQSGCSVTKLVQMLDVVISIRNNLHSRNISHDHMIIVCWEV